MDDASSYQSNKKNVRVEMTEIKPEDCSDRHILRPGRDVVLPQQWPADPVPLKPSPASEAMLNAYDFLLCFIPLVLIAKVVLCVIASIKDRSHHGYQVDLVSPLTTNLIKFNGQLTTAFTIIFVTIMTTLVRRLALWKAQRGAYLADLEQLQASISLPSTIKMVWSLRAFTFTSLGLCAVWSFYYLGSQASKLEYQFVDSRPFKNLPAAYQDPNLPSFFSFPEKRNDTASINMLNIEFIGAVQFGQSINQGTSDSKGFDATGNALVPVLEYVINPYFNAIPETPGDGGWVDVSKASQDAYSSYLGNPVYIHEPGADDEQYFYSYQLVGDYTFNSSYFLASCEVPSLHPYDAFPRGVLPNTSVSMNMTDARATASTPRQFELWGRWIKDDTYTPWQTGSMKSLCNITTTNVEVAVHCVSTGCLARKMRFTDQHKQNSTATPFDDDSFASSFFSNFLLSTGVQTDAHLTTMVENVIDLWDLENTFFDDPTGPSDRSYDIGVTSASLTELLNTYYQNSLVPRPGGPDLLTIQSVVEGHTNPSYLHTTLHGEIYDPQYALSIPWIVIDLISCKILFVAAIICWWLRKQTLAPDIFGYVSTLTRDNPNLNLPDGGTTLSGLDRSRLLKNVKIRIADVNGPDGGVGRVGVHCVGDDLIHAGGLTSDKRYV